MQHRHADDRDAIIARLGPDPLRRDAKADAPRSHAQEQATIGQLLLDQKVLAGVGNVFRAEALFVNGIHPAAGPQLDPPRTEAIWTTIAAMLRRV